MNKKKAILLAFSFSLCSLRIIAMESDMSISPASSPSSLPDFSPSSSPGQSTSPPLSSSPISTPWLLKGPVYKSLQLSDEKPEISQKEPHKKFIFSTTVKPSGPGLEAWPVFNMILPSKSKAVATDLKGGALCSNGSTQDATGDILAALIDLNKKSGVEYETRILHIITAILENEIPTNKNVIETTQRHLRDKIATCNKALSLIDNGMPTSSTN